MQTVSEGFKAAILAAERQCLPRLTFEVIDRESQLNNSKSASSESVISRIDQATDGVRDSKRYATFEPGRWPLNGSVALPPALDELPEAQVGWWSDNLCDENGIFSNPETLDIVFAQAANLIGVSITFDPAFDECAKDFALTVYDANNSEIHIENVINNRLARFVLEQGLQGVKRISVAISTWSVGYRRARVLEVDFGIVYVYGAGDMTDLNVLREVDLLSESLPAGELKYVLDNQAKRFSVFGPSGAYHGLQKRQPVKAELGAEVDGQTEFVPVGMYYLTDWASDEEAMTASFTARDRLDWLSQGRYRRGSFGQKSLYDLAADILDDAGIDNYVLDDCLKVIHTSQPVPVLSHREALRIVAQASRCVVYVDTDDVLRVQRLVDEPAGMMIGLGDVYEIPKITLEPVTASVSVDKVNLLVSDEVEEVYKATHNISGQMSLIISYNGACTNHQVSVVGGAVVSAEHYAYTSYLVISGAGPVEVTVAAYTAEERRSTHTEYAQGILPSDVTTTAHIDNPLIDTDLLAADVAAWVLAELNRRLRYEIYWRQNPALDIGDTVGIEAQPGQALGARVMRQEYIFDGALEGKTDARGVLP